MYEGECRWVGGGGISTEILDPEELLRRVQGAPSMAGLNLVREVTTREVYEWNEPSESEWDYCPPGVESTTDPTLTITTV